MNRLRREWDHRTCILVATTVFLPRTLLQMFKRFSFNLIRSHQVSFERATAGTKPSKSRFRAMQTEHRNSPLAEASRTASAALWIRAVPESQIPPQNLAGSQPGTSNRIPCGRSKPFCCNPGGLFAPALAVFENPLSRPSQAWFSCWAVRRMPEPKRCNESQGVWYVACFQWFGRRTTFRCKYVQD